MVEVYLIPGTRSILGILRASWYCEYSQYSQNQRTTVLVVPAVQNPEILKSTGSMHSNEPRNTASLEVSAELNLETLRVLVVSANINLKHWECTKYQQ